MANFIYLLIIAVGLEFLAGLVLIKANIDEIRGKRPSPPNRTVGGNVIVEDDDERSRPLSMDVAAALF